jgi:hypothetical protein
MESARDQREYEEYLLALSKVDHEQCTPGEPCSPVGAILAHAYDNLCGPHLFPNIRNRHEQCNTPDGINETSQKTSNLRILESCPDQYHAERIGSSGR